MSSFCAWVRECGTRNGVSGVGHNSKAKIVAVESFRENDLGEGRGACVSRGRKIIVTFFTVLLGLLYFCKHKTILEYITVMSTKEKALALGQDPEVIKDAERRIAAYEKEHGKPMSKTMQGALMLRGLLEVYDKTLLL